MPVKRIALEPAQMEEAVLNLMSRPQFAFITIAKLSQELQRPLSAISAQVKQLCVRQEDGPNKGLYTLKPEYKLATDSEIVPMDISGAPAAAVQPASMRPPTSSAMFAMKTEIKREM